MKVKEALIYLFFCYSPFIFSQGDAIQLIPPTGEYGVGTIIYEWVDTSREIQITTHQGDKRTLIVQLWYPATIDSSSVRAPYAALSKDYQQVITHSYLRPAFSEVRQKCNLILISPGRGTERFLYTTLIEELASHGYVVASVDMPQIGMVTYQDGLIIPPSDKFQPPGGLMSGPYEKVDRFFEEPTELGYQDLMFAYEKIRELNASDPNDRFTGRIDVEATGLFGHSLGGRIAGKFAAEQEQVKAYISMEGIPPREIRYEGKLDIPVAMLCSSGTWPFAKENYFSLIDNRNSPVYMIELVGFGHNSVTDNPFIYPGSFKYEIDPTSGLEISRKIILNYFESIFKEEDRFAEVLRDMKQVNLNTFE